MDNNATPEPHVWQVGDLLTVANKSEQRLIVSVTQTAIEVIAENGWYNRYQINPDSLPLHYLRSSDLTYTYTGREQLFKDFQAGAFTTAFN